MGEIKNKSEFDLENIIPSDIPDFKHNLENWGNEMLNTIQLILENLNMVMGLPDN